MTIILPCPNCSLLVYIQDINCAIFRHGIYKTNGEQIDPHLCKEKCDELSKRDQIWGCGKPFKLILINDSEAQLVACDYI